MNVSVLIPTKNEERNLQACLDSVAWANEIIVYDSFSNDSTVEIAKKNNVKIVQRQFDNFSTHKNWALDHIEFRNTWILIVDADECITPLLAEEINRLLQKGPDKNGYYIARKNYFDGKWIRHGGWYPDWNLRLFKLGHACYEERIVHEHMLVDGPAGYLQEPLLHYDDKGMERYFDRHNIYSSLEAVECYQFLHKKKQMGTLKEYWKSGPHRRRFLKQLAYRYLPCRPLFKFLWMYFFKLGFLDGRIGLRFCLLHTFYEYQIALKVKELETKDSPMQKKYQVFSEESCLNDPREKSTCLLCQDHHLPISAEATENGNHQLKPVYNNIFDTRFGIKETYTISQCQQCGLLQTTPLPGQETLNTLYEKFYNFSGKQGLYTKLRQFFYHSFFYKTWLMLDGDIAFHCLQGTGRLLDIGCNEGRGLQLFNKHGFSVEGLETNSTAAKQAKQSDFTVHEVPLEQFEPNAPYDAVILSNVLEHALLPRMMLSHIHRILKPGGKLYLSCPNANSWLKNIFGKYWINWHVPFHLSHFNQTQLCSLINQSGFTVRSTHSVTPAIWVTQSILACLFAKKGKSVKQMRNPGLILGFMFLTKCLGFPLLWLGNQLGKGDCLVIVAEKKK